MAKIGELLIKKGVITQEQLDVALKEGQRASEILGKTLLRLGFISEKQLLEILGQQLGLVYYASLRNVPVKDVAIKAVPAKFVLYYKFMPLDLKDKQLTIAVSDPLAIWPMEDLKLHLGYDVERVLAPEEEIMDAIRRAYGVGAETVEEILHKEKEEGRPAQKESSPQIEEIEKSAQDSSVIKLVNQILSEAVSAQATDIHIEAFRDKARVRHRVDGILYPMRLPDEIRFLYGAIISRIKIISNLNVVERRLPQDGRAIVKVKDKQVDLRISIIPSGYGENVVIRILPLQLLFNLDDLGFMPNDLVQVEELIKKPHGIVFLTGPTGSGKTTTLYAFLSKLNKETIKIITIEDPIEYELFGVMQLQIKPEIGFTFANALRSILRHDPDVMMVGEVRDHETAELAIRTALTGHLIFSSLHTNDSFSGATRLLDIGIEPYLVASSVNAFISQRLVRVICPHCKYEVEDKSALPDYFKNLRVYAGKGCDNCKSIGYKGRTAIYEILTVNDAIQELIIAKATSAQIKHKAISLGTKTLLESGIEKVKMGITTPEEVLRVTGIEEESGPAS